MSDRPASRRAKGLAGPRRAVLICTVLALGRGALLLGAQATAPPIETRLDRLEDPKTGKINHDVYGQLVTEGKRILPALAKRLEREDCSALVAALAVRVAPKEGLDLVLDGLAKGRWRLPRRNACGIVHVVGRCATGSGAWLDSSGGLVYMGSTGTHVTTTSMPLHLDGDETLKRSAGIAAILFRYVVGNAPAFGRCRKCNRDIRQKWFALHYSATAHLGPRDAKEPAERELLYTIKLRYTCAARHSGSTEVRIRRGGRIEAASPPRAWHGRMAESDYRQLGKWLTGRSRIVVGDAEPAEAVELLNSKDPVVRLNAARTLGSLKARAAVAPLTRSLKDADRDVRLHAADALGAIGHRDATPALIELLKSDDKELQLRAIQALGAIKDPLSAKPLLAGMCDPERNHAHFEYALAELLRRLPGPGIEAVADVFMHDKRPEIRKRASYVLVRVGPRGIDGFIAALKSPDGDVRREAVRGLGVIARGHRPRKGAPLATGMDEVVPAIRSALWDKDARVSGEARRALASLPTPLPEAWRTELAPAASELVKDLGRSDGHGPLRVLGDLGPPAAPPLIEALRSDNLNVQRAAAVGLSKVGDSTVIRLLMAKLSTKHEGLRRTAVTSIHTLAARLGTFAVPPLAQFLKSGETPLMRATAAGALALAGKGAAAPQCIEPLIGALADTAPAVREAAAESLRRIGRSTWGAHLVEAAAKPLVRLLGHDAPTVRAKAACALTALLDLTRHPAAKVRESVVTVLGRIKDTRAVDGLLAALGDQSPTVRVKALTALRSNTARGEAAAVFVEALSSEDAAIRKEALWQLRLMASWEDRLDCGEDPAKWRAWLEKRRHAEKTKGRKASQR